MIRSMGAASSAEAIQIVQNLGYPEMMDLDHDLGGNDTAMIFVKWLFENGKDSNLRPPAWRIHSKNPIGVANLQSYLSSWERSLSL